MNGKAETVIVRGIKISDNFYIVESNKNSLNTCFISHIDEAYVWHQRLGHVNYKDLSNLSKKDLVKGLPKLTSLKIPYVVYVNLENKL